LEHLQKFKLFLTNNTRSLAIT